MNTEEDSDLQFFVFAIQESECHCYTTVASGKPQFFSSNFHQKVGGGGGVEAASLLAPSVICSPSARFELG